VAKDISKDIFAPAKNRKLVNFSKLRPVADFEANELQKITLFQVGEQWMNLHGAGPIGDAFQVDLTADSLAYVVRSGTFVLPGGFAVVVPQDVVVPAGSVPVGTRTDYLYLNYMIDEEDSVESPELIATDILGPNAVVFGETATRDRYVMSFEVAEGSLPVSLGAGEALYVLATSGRTATAVIDPNEITDTRRKFGATYVRSGLKFKIDPSNPFQVNWGAGTVSVEGVTTAVSAGNYVASPGAIQYLYVTGAGAVQQALTLPLHSVLPAVRLESSLSATTIFDLRRFAPSSGTGGGGGTEVEYVTLDNLQPGDPVYLSSASQVSLADADIPARTPAIGVAVDAVTSGNIARIMVVGDVDDPSWSWTAGQIVYLASGGGLTQTDFTETDANKGKIRQKLGVAVTPTRIHVNVDPDHEVVGEQETVDMVIRGVTELGDANTDIIRQKGLVAELDTRTTETSFDLLGRLSQVLEKNGITTLRTLTFNYVGATTDVATSVEVVDGKTITSTYTYGVGGDFTITKSVI
jgi:hypothetical protein